MKCKLDPLINAQCKYYNMINGECKKIEHCSFKYQDGTIRAIRLEPKWYERYNDPYIRDKHRRVWKCYAPVTEAYDEHIQWALREIEAIPDLPADFEIVAVKIKEGEGIEVQYKNAGECEVDMMQILDVLRKRTQNYFIHSELSEVDLKLLNEWEYKKKKGMW